MRPFSTRYIQSRGGKGGRIAQRSHTLSVTVRHLSLYDEASDPSTAETGAATRESASIEGTTEVDKAARTSSGSWLTDARCEYICLCGEIGYVAQNRFRPSLRPVCRLGNQMTARSERLSCSIKRQSQAVSNPPAGRKRFRRVLGLLFSKMAIQHKVEPTYVARRSYAA